MNKELPYSLRIAMAHAMKDQKAIDRIVLECLEDVSQELLGVAGGFHRNDLPFVVAAMKMTASSLESVLDDDEKAFVDELCKKAIFAMIDLSELRRQTEEEYNDGGDEKC